MSQKTRTFTMGHATVFQDKQSEETRKYLEMMKQGTENKADELLMGGNVYSCEDILDLTTIAERLADKDEREISIVLNGILSKIRDIKNSKKKQ